MRNPRRLLFVAFAAFGLAHPSIAADATPRYRLEVGQQLTYRTTRDFKYDNNGSTGSMGNNDEWTAWVVRKNDDGGWRLIVRTHSVSTRDGKTQGDPDEMLAYVDLAPDGAIAPNDSFGYRFDPTPLFPKLPKDAAQAERGWEDVRTGRKSFTADGTSHFKVITAGKGDEPWAFEEVRDSPLNKIYGFTFRNRFTFDPRRGAIGRIESEDGQGWGFVGKGSGTTELVSIETRDADWIAKLAAEADRYFAASTHYGELTTKASKEPVDPKEAAVAKAGQAINRLAPRVRLPGQTNTPLLTEAKETLTKARDASTLPMIRELLDAQIKQHDQMATYYRDGAIRRAEVVGQPAAEWETKDLDGKPHALKEYRGKVVVLDFWYRGCGWCIRAMPQINQLADDFKGQPVAILGMNTDREEKDAKFVVEAMALKYPNLKAEGLPQKYGVQGFPTLILIGPDGTVRDLHVGYSPTLREEVAKEIKALLSAK
jgi:thiol-disulfide isomerase/thioredoxin